MNQFEKQTINQIVTWVFQCARQFAKPNLDIDDVAQITLEKILKTKSLPRVLSYKWVYVTTSNVKNDMLRNLYRERRFLDSRISLDSVRLGLVPEEVFPLPLHRHDETDAFLFQALDHSLENLQPHKKETLLLYRHGHSYKEIAAMTNAPLNTIRTRIHYAKREMQNAVSA